MMIDIDSTNNEYRTHINWPALIVRASEQGSRQSGLGVFAAQGLRPWDSIPILGRAITQRKYQELADRDLATHVSFTTAGLVDGHPRYHPWNGIGGRGQFITSLINEPTRRKPNVIMRGTNVVVVQPIPKGSELLISYGPEYTRDYCVSRYTLEKQQYKTFKD